MIALKAQWSVTAGLIPDQIMPEHTRIWTYTNVMKDKDPEGIIFTNLGIDAHAYAKAITDPALINWVKIEFIWI